MEQNQGSYQVNANNSANYHDKDMKNKFSLDYNLNR